MPAEALWMHKITVNETIDTYNKIELGKIPQFYFVVSEYGYRHIYSNA